MLSSKQQKKKNINSVQRVKSGKTYYYFHKESLEAVAIKKKKTVFFRDISSIIQYTKKLDLVYWLPLIFLCRISSKIENVSKIFWKITRVVLTEESLIRLSYKQGYRVLPFLKLPLITFVFYFYFILFFFWITILEMEQSFFFISQNLFSSSFFFFIYLFFRYRINFFFFSLLSATIIALVIRLL